MQTTNASGSTGLISAYLPRTLLERLPQAPESGVWHERLPGTLMHCDMSGFTAMSERLAGRGNEGAELMVGVLNRFFDRMLTIADGWGGTQMKFGGDAMLLYFGGVNHAARAAACALEMQRAMREFRTVTVAGEDFALRMRAGFHSAEFLSASAGCHGGPLHYLLVGRDVTRAAATEALAPLGGVVASPEAAVLLDGARLVRHGDVVRVTSIDEPLRPPVISQATETADIASRYLLPPFAREFAEGRAPHIVAEHRRVTAIFINLTGTATLEDTRGDAEVALQAGEYLRFTLEALDRHSGVLVGSDAGDHGDKLIAMFGAPVGTEDDETNALRFALELQRSLQASDLDLQHQIGVSTGYVFAGEVGSEHRREYTIIGDSVNLAARMMAAAPPGHIYVTAATAERVPPDAFDLRKLKPLSVKGKSEPVRAFSLIAERARVRGPRRDESAPELIGREPELRVLLDAATADRDAACWLTIAGEAGIGKSALAEALARRLEAAGWRLLTSYSQMHLSRDVFAAWQEPLSDLYGAHAADAHAYETLRQSIAALVPTASEFAPLLAPLLGLPDQDEPSLRYLDPRARRRRIAETVVASLRETAGERPLLLLFEDINRADGPSVELLAEVLERGGANIALCTTSRELSPPEGLESRTSECSVDLKELSPVDARRVAMLAGAGEDEADSVVARAQGNPLFLQELALNTDSAGTSETINDVILARIDRLEGRDKAFLRAAAIEGVMFRRVHVARLLNASRRDDGLSGTLERLAGAGFTRRSLDATDAYVFRHTLTQEVLYDTLPFAERRTMHGALAREIESESGAALAAHSGSLLHHFERAEDWPQSVVYGCMAGERAASVYAAVEAISYYARAVSAVQRLPMASASDVSLLTQRIGESMEMQGRHSAAAEALRDALTAWRWRGPRRVRRLLKPDVPDGVRESALARSLSVSRERAHAGYDDALAALDEALAALPARSGAVGSQVYATLSVTYYRRGDYREATVWGKRALAAARRTGDAHAIAYAHNMLANALNAEGSLRSAVRHLREAVRLYEQTNDVPGQAAANNNLGMNLQYLGDLDEALACYRLALAADERVGDTVDMAIAHNNIGEILLIQGALGEAEDNFNLAVQGSGGDEELIALAGLANVNRCRVALARGDLVTADDRLREGERLLQQSGAHGLVTEARLQRAELLYARGDQAGALREAQRGYDEARESGDRRLEARGERMLGLAHVAAGNHSAAGERFSASATLARKIGEGYEEALALQALARNYAASGRRVPAAVSRRAASLFERMRAAGPGGVPPGANHQDPS